MTHSHSPHAIRQGILACLFALLVSTLVSPGHSLAAEGNLPPEVQKSVSAILALQKGGEPDKATLATFLDFATSPLVLKGTDDKKPVPDKYDGAHGILWRTKLNVPLGTLLEYLYNPNVPTTFLYPASIRYSRWQPGSDLLTLQEPLWKQFGKNKDKPLVLRGSEIEEISPDTFSGAYYKYTLDRLLILTEYEGRQVLVSVAWQRGNSDVGKKAAVIGDYDNWDFVYSNAKGTLAKGIGWAETYIYTSVSLVVFYEATPGSATTGYSMLRWMSAGWTKMNMVKGHHIEAGAERSFKGLKAFLETSKRPSAAELSKYVTSLRNTDLAVLQKKFEPYSAKVEAAAATTEALKTEDFQSFIKDAGYGKSMNKDQIVAAFCINHLKQILGKPLLAGPLD